MRSDFKRTLSTLKSLMIRCTSDQLYEIRFLMIQIFKGNFSLPFQLVNLDEILFSNWRYGSTDCSNLQIKLISSFWMHWHKPCHTMGCVPDTQVHMKMQPVSSHLWATWQMQRAKLLMSNFFNMVLDNQAILVRRGLQDLVTLKLQHTHIHLPALLSFL